ncbi:hypothetical protein [Flavobacterium tructae]|nr:hypothetical protein [Flavobacterium tructae]
MTQIIFSNVKCKMLDVVKKEISVNPLNLFQSVCDKWHKDEADYIGLTG